MTPDQQERTVERVEHLRTLTDDDLQDAERRIDTLCDAVRSLAVIVRTMAGAA